MNAPRSGLTRKENGQIDIEPFQLWSSALTAIWASSVVKYLARTRSIFESGLNTYDSVHQLKIRLVILCSEMALEGDEVVKALQGQRCLCFSRSLLRFLQELSPFHSTICGLIRGVTRVSARRYVQYK